jgi:hypothetical protein
MIYTSPISRKQSIDLAIYQGTYVKLEEYFFFIRAIVGFGDDATMEVDSLREEPVAFIDLNHVDTYPLSELKPFLVI